MNERMSISDKKPEVKIQNLASQVQRKAESFHSIISPVDRILFLQRTIGNQAVGNLIKSGALQAKLRIGQLGDIYEQKADMVADKVMRMPDISKAKDARVQRKCPNCEGEVRRQPEKEEENLQTKKVSSSITEVHPELESRINLLKSGGQPLPDSVRAFFEPRFGTNFSHVKVHTDTFAAHSASAIGAKAYTFGNDIVFGDGNFAPATASGKGLLAHELSHVMQQRGSRVPSGKRLSIGNENSPLEQESMEMATAVALGNHIPSPHNAPLQLLRATHTFSLTFDDGPHPAELNKGINLTEKVLNALKSKGVQAAFFIQKAKFLMNKKAGHDLIMRMKNEGHTVGIHTGGAKEHEKHTEAQKAGHLEKELSGAKGFIKSEIGIEPTRVRPPGGFFDKDVLATYAKEGLTMMLWDIEGDRDCHSVPALKTQMDNELKRVDNIGWKTKTPSNNLVILYHDINPVTASNLGDMIDFIKRDTKKVSKEKAEIAEKKVVTAIDKADKAKEGAVTAREKADKAKEEAEKAKKAAASAKKNSGAKKKADEAMKKADAAKKKADKAKEEAEKAKNEADNAKMKADVAKKEIGPADFAPL